ncbi:creatininase family protein [Variovorax sp. KK3]|uniref:creatininase family protein n=1 Tax=Variovorax sp. KK3 TaxID=1855728 RepID=UPI00097C368B|nr:creatininase family protein [Variovorax sp. KK3]
MSLHELSLLSSTEIGELGKQAGSIAIVPSGALEAHGPHLPIANDSLYIERLIKEVAGQLPGPVVCTPVVMGGLSHRHRRYPGTVVLSPDAYKAGIASAVQTFVRAGFQRIALVSGHGGNFPAMREVERATQGLHPNASIRAFGGFGRTFTQPLEQLAEEMELRLCKSEGHAGMFQTSIALHLFPELVGDYLSVTGYTAGETGWWKTLATQGAHALHPTGVIGDPSRASKDFGRLGFERLVENFRTWLVTAFTKPSDWRYRERDAATFDYLDPEDFDVTPERP